MKIKKNIRYACLALVFVMLGTSTFFASKSFASYVDSHKVESPGDVANPITTIYRGRLIRTDIHGGRYVYPLNNQAGTYVFENLAPEDIIDYYFYLSNESFNGEINEVLLKVTVEIRVYLKRLGKNKPDGTQPDGTDPNFQDSYFIVGNEYLLGEEGKPESDMKNANLLFGISKHNYMSYDENDYLFTQRDVNTDGVPLTNADYVTGNIMHVMSKTNGSSTAYYHTTGFYLEPNSKPYEQGYLLKITIPEQAGDYEKYEYVAGRLFIEINITAEQVLNKE